MTLVKPKQVSIRSLEDTLKMLDAEINRDPKGWVGTEYEQKRGIRTEEVEWCYIGENMRIYNKIKSDGSKSFYVLFRVGKKSPYWFTWTVTKDQAQALTTEFPRHYWSMENHNHANRITLPGVSK